MTGVQTCALPILFLEKWNGQLIPSFGSGSGMNLNFADLTDIMKSYVGVDAE